MAKIDDFQWGMVTVGAKTYKDVLLGPDLVQEWDWQVNNTRHAGINVKDFDFVSNNVEFVVISRGVQNKLQCSEEIIAMLKDKGKTVYHLQTTEAILKYNDLVEREEKVAALIHSTC